MAAVSALDAFAVTAAALAVIGLPAYALVRDGLLPGPRRRD